MRGRQVDLEVREEVRADGRDPLLAQYSPDDLRHHVGATAIEGSGSVARSSRMVVVAMVMIWVFNPGQCPDRDSLW